MSSLPLSDYAMLSDCHTAALVSRHGSVDWLGFPRFDAPTVFGRLVDLAAGYWAIRPGVAPTRIERRYVGRSLVLETTFHTADGTLHLTDALAVGEGEPRHELGAHAPRALLRRARCSSGCVPVVMEWVPRAEYGRVHPLLRFRDHLVHGRGGASRLALSADVPLWSETGSARSYFLLAAGQDTCFAFQHAWSWEDEPRGWSQDEIRAGIARTVERWEEWSEDHQSYQGAYREHVLQSGRVLHGLTYQPTGAIVAAPTTSLPEAVGGARNWDYRYTWVRDASLTLHALWVAACPDEAARFFEFLGDAAFTQLHRGLDLQVMFGVGGEHDLSERELPHLSGWRRSRPVRIGNAAWRQRQLDAYGAILGAAEKLRRQLGRLDEPTRQFLIEAADEAASRWRERDHGIWEVRDEPRHFLHSKLMCWVAVDRAIALAPLLRAEAQVEGWRRARAEIRRAILERGFDAEQGAFTQAFDSRALDASCLVMPLVGFLPPDDPRIRGTIEAIAAGLTDEHGLVYRYRGDDGLPGEEGTFLLCTFWLAEALALGGELERAEETFRRALAFRSDLGLLAEQVDPRSGELRGNYPQAFSHIGVIEAAWAIDEARRSAPRPPRAPELGLPGAGP